MAGIFQTHIIACPVFVLKYTFDNILKSLHQKYSASLKAYLFIQVLSVFLDPSGI